jgi:hypothetical protein
MARRAPSRLRSPYIVRSARAHRIAVSSPVAGVSAETAVAAVRNYYRFIGLYQVKSAATAHALTFSADDLQTMAKTDTYSNELWSSFPLDRLAAPYEAAGIVGADAVQWRAMAVGPGEAGEWLRAGVARDEVLAWRDVTPYPSYAHKWRRYNFTPERAKRWVTGARVLDAHDAAVWEASGVDPNEVREWSRFPAETALWWRSQGLTAWEADDWLCRISHTDKESREAYLRSRN